METRVRLFAEKIGAGLKKNYAADFHRLKLACERMKNAESAILSQKEYSINKAIGSLDNLNPARILKSGYFRVYADNLPITDVDGVKCGDDIMIKGADGKIFANVTGVEKENI